MNGLKQKKTASARNADGVNIPRRQVNSGSGSAYNKNSYNSASSSPKRPQASKTAQTNKATTVSKQAKKPSSSSDLKNNLKSQTPLNRKLMQKNIAPEPAMKRRSKQQYFRIKSDKRKERSVLKNRILLVLVLYAILMPIAVGIFWAWLPKHQTPETNNYTYQIGPDNNVISKKVYSWSTVRSGDTYYLDMSGIADLCNMTTTGDSKSMKFTSKDSGESVEFFLNESLAFINGIPCRMDDISYLKNDKVYVPMDFVKNSFKGLTVTLNTDTNKITIIRETDKTGAYLPLVFPFKQASLSYSIDFSSLDKELQEEINLRNGIGTLPPVNTPNSNVKN
ncbi:MAG: hypothetical protein IJO00_00880 [Clostridia bacterium]|nr:hypothetical protein [Clostridia bacterium]